VPLTPGRSIAVDKALHVYGTPFFIEGQLPIETERSKTPFHRLMIAQDTGSAIVGPARADLYFGAGAEAGRVSGRLRHNARFVMLIPKSLDPVARGRKVPVPDERPTETIAKLFPPADPLRDPAMDTRTGVKPVETAPAAGASKDAPSVKEPPKSAVPAPVPAAQASAAATSIAKPVPLPEARPKLAPPRDVRRQRQYRFQ
jgi:membrane-bound lytic murein transglycosylase A